MVRGKGEGAIYFKPSRGLWIGRFELPTHGGERRRKEFSAKTKAGVLEKRRQYMAQFEAAGDLPTGSMLTEKWLDYWLNNVAVKKLRPKTLASYRSLAKNHIAPAIGKTRIDKITPAHVRRVLTTMEKSGAAPTSCRNAFSTMSAAFRSAEREGHIHRNPCDLMDAPLKGIPDLEVLTTDEARRLVDAFKNTPDAFLWATFLLTGARRGEILGLEWDRMTSHYVHDPVSDEFVETWELDLSWQLQRLTWDHGCVSGSSAPTCGYKYGAYCPKRVLEVPNDYEYRHLEGGLYLTRPKSRAGWRIIPLVDPLASILIRWRDMAPPNLHGLMFTEDGRPIDPDRATSAWPKVLADTGIDKRVRIHDLRHTAVDLLYAAGVPEHIIILIVGHSNRLTSRSYRSRGDRTMLRQGMVDFSSLLAIEPTR
jgi:integrase